MKLSESFDKVIEILEVEKIDYALAGGIIANLYRNEIRVTNDIDIAVLLDSTNEATLKSILQKLDLNYGEVREGDLKNIPFRRSRAKSIVQIIVGRNPINLDSVGVDFLLKTLPWVKEAIERAKINIVDIYDKKVHCLTLEDMIISKLFALKNQVRFKDLDDLENFLDQKNQINLSYLLGRMNKHELIIPNEIISKVKLNSELLKVSKEIEKKKKLKT